MIPTVKLSLPNQLKNVGDTIIISDWIINLVIIKSNNIATELIIEI